MQLRKMVLLQLKKLRLKRKQVIHVVKCKPQIAQILQHTLGDDFVAAKPAVYVVVLI